ERGSASAMMDAPFNAIHQMHRHQRMLPAAKLRAQKVSGADRKKNGGPERPPSQMKEESSPFGSRCGAYTIVGQALADSPCRNGISQPDAFEQQNIAHLLSHFAFDQQFSRGLAPQCDDQDAEHSQPSADAHAQVEMIMRDQ